MSTAPSSVQTPKAMTVDALIDRLGQIKAQGGGHNRVCLPFDPGHSTMGSTPTLPLTEVSVGFDWNSGTVMLHLPEHVGRVDAELRLRLRRMEDALGRTLLCLRRNDHTAALTAAEQGLIRANAVPTAAPEAKPEVKAPVKRCAQHKA